MDNIVNSIICSQFESTFGQRAGLGTLSDRTCAMQIKFSISPNYEVEEGYRDLTLLLFGGGTNYIAVYAKLDWDVTKDQRLLSDELEEVEPHYIHGASPWVCYGYHDSCWREAVENVLREFHGRIDTLDYLFNGITGWYKSVPLTEEQIAELKSIRNARYENNGPWVWKKLSDQEFHFPTDELAEPVK